MTDATDERIIAASLDTPERFSELVERHHAVIFRYAARRVGVQVAEDIAAETFTAAFASRARYRTDGPSARPWLFGIATNMLRRHRRTEARLLEAYAKTGCPEHLDAPGDEVGAALAAVLAGMRRQHRDALLLHAWADLTYDEIAAAMDVPVGTVRTWISRARATATRELAGFGVEPRTTTAPPEAIDA